MRPQNRKINSKGRPVRTKIQLRVFKQKAYRFGTEEARTCEAWFQLTFRPQKWNLKANMWYQLSPFTGSNVAIAIQHDPGNIQHQDKSFSSWLAAATLSLRLLTGLIWITWRFADQLVCFKRILLYSDLKYDPPRRPREMRIINPRLRIMMLIRR